MLELFIFSSLMHFEMYPFNGYVSADIKGIFF